MADVGNSEEAGVNTAKDPTPSEDAHTAKNPKTEEANTNTEQSADTHTLREPTDNERKDAKSCAPVKEFSFTGFGQEEFDYSAFAKQSTHAFDPVTVEARKKERRRQRAKSKEAAAKKQ
ncbi:unnamed protein product [Bursaphelenchus okinawaensis]|uniref:Uncharacterized protein n=1 Tax=Bursaphelenchus okinawaensis TaxID=465554 RepID=A0A811L9Z5_9BILA|nr:unnamed protein product [Bursaphelenchus okinawaensis]CAG9120405.1 unnamed protein product [Bursaphelenchus okinawaensis]